MAAASRQVYEFGEWHLDPTERLLSRNGEPVAVGPKVFDILLLLVERAGSLVTKDEFMGKVWQDAFVEDGTACDWPVCSRTGRVSNAGESGRNTTGSGAYRPIARSSIACSSI